MRVAALLLVLLPASAVATGLGDHGQDFYDRGKTEVLVSGYLRTRGDWLHNLDLDRGTTPSGQPLFPVPLGSPSGQSLLGADMRLRTDVAVYAPFATAAVKLRVDVIDNLALGSTPVLSPGAGNAPTPAASPGQLPSSLVRVKRAYGEALTPIGLLSAGRMGSHFGLGLVANGGDCLDCDGGDAADRIAFVTPLAGHLWAVAYDFSAVGPTAVRRDEQRAIVLDPATDVRSVSFAVMELRDETTRARRRKADKSTLQYGLIGSYRWQDADVPVDYLNINAPVVLSPSSVMARGYQALLGDIWARFDHPLFRVELEAAVVLADCEQPSLVPGVLLAESVQALQWGGALETQLGGPDAWLKGGLNAGVASGDDSPGFGAFPGGATKTQDGDLDGPQLSLPYDTRIDNFRFNADYRVDHLFFREILGTVTDAVYVRPWVEARLFEALSSALRARAGATWSRAVYARSTPGGEAALGLELDGGLGWQNRDGFDARLDYAVLFPFAGLDNAAAGLDARPAQLLRVRLAWVL